MNIIEDSSAICFSSDEKAKEVDERQREVTWWEDAAQSLSVSKL